MSRNVFECDEKADVAIGAMVLAAVGGEIAPPMIDWGVAMAAMGSGVVAIGIIYDVKLTKDEAWKLVKQFILSAGFTWVALNAGTQIFKAIMKVTGWGYGPDVVLGSVITGAIAYAVGACAKEYFRRDYMGKGRPSTEELGKIFREAFDKKKRR